LFTLSEMERADRIMADDGRSDIVYCGSGTDYVYADVRDTVYYGCETVKR